MKVAIVGSRSLVVLHLEDYLPAGITEIVSGGAVGVDTCAKRYAQAHGIALKEFLPDYQTWGRRAPLVRNLQIIDYADMVVAFWDQSSHGTKFVIDHARRAGKKVIVYCLSPQK